MDYETFKDMGEISFLQDYKRIHCHFIFDVKHDLRHKARFVAGGHLTDMNKDSNYSGVVSLRSMRICLLVGLLNGCEAQVGDVGNAYLEAYTNKKVCFVAGPEFGPLAGHTLVIVKAFIWTALMWCMISREICRHPKRYGILPFQGGS